MPRNQLHLLPFRSMVKAPESGPCVDQKTTSSLAQAADGRIFVELAFAQAAGVNCLISAILAAGKRVNISFK
jgi:hypothetical protein